jgi:hypothetical protein
MDEITQEDLQRITVLFRNMVNGDIMPIKVKNKQTGKYDLLICITKILPGVGTACIPIASVFNNASDLNVYETPEGAKLEHETLRTDESGQIILPDKYNPNNN